jgi:hypothetical protein
LNLDSHPHRFRTPLFAVIDFVFIEANVLYLSLRIWQAILILRQAKAEYASLQLRNYRPLLTSRFRRGSNRNATVREWTEPCLTEQVEQGGENVLIEAMRLEGC